MSVKVRANPGRIPAHELQPGQYIWTLAGWARVSKVSTSFGVTRVTVGLGQIAYQSDTIVSVQDYAEGGD